jgi:chemotaxis family two-component system sensor kinase Cph1
VTTPVQDGFCDGQPVIQASAQAFGILFVLGPELEILQASVNVESVLGIPWAKLIGTDFTALVSAADREILKRQLKAGDARRLNGWELELPSHAGPRRFVACASIGEGCLILGLEFTDGESDALNVLVMRNRLTRLSLEIKQCGSLAEICDQTTTQLKSILAVDKVMVYRFDESWHGTVLSEAKEPQMETYLDLRFPATDIPEPARRLYALNPIRMIPDAGYAPVRLEPPLNAVTGKPTDLSACIARGVAPVHLEYLRNMGVTASISISIVRDDVLWGLLALHHRTPKALHASVRNALELLSECFAARLTTLEAAASRKGVESLFDFRVSVMDAVHQDTAPVPVILRELEKTMRVLGAQGIAVLLEGQWFVRGDVPVREELLKLVDWLRDRAEWPLHVTAALSRDYEAGKAIVRTAGGLVAASISGRFEDAVLWFRPEVQQLVKWGGDPGQTVVFDADGQTYHPRQSFRIWKEIVRLQSLPWTVQERTAAGDIRRAVAEAMLDLRSAKLKSLSGIVPICSYCRRIRDEKDSWRLMEEYIETRSTAKFSHGLCPECFTNVMKAEGLGDDPA